MRKLKVFTLLTVLSLFSLSMVSCDPDSSIVENEQAEIDEKFQATGQGEVGDPSNEGEEEEGGD